MPLGTRKLQRAAASGSFGKKSPALECRAAPRRGGWRRLARPIGSQVLNLPTKQLLRPTVTDRALAELGQNNSSLFGQFPTPAIARGAYLRSPAGISSRLCSRTTVEIPLNADGVPLGTRRLELARQQTTTALRGRRPQRTSLNQENHNKSPEWGPRRDRRCFVSLGPDGREKRSLSARWRKSAKQLLVVWPISYSSSRARGDYPYEQELPYADGGPTKAKITPAKHPTGAPGGRCLPARGMGHSGEKTVSVRTNR